jgi:hypothetical protein
MKKIIMAWVLLLFSAISSSARAQSTAPYELVNGTFDSNNTLSASSYEITIGNNLPGANEISSGDYALSGSLSGSAITAPVAASRKIYLPVVRR